MRKIAINIFLILLSGLSFTQNSIKAEFSGLANQQIRLSGYSGFETYMIDSVQADKNGHFQLSFDKDDVGIAYLQSEQNKSLVVILEEAEDLKLKGETLEFTESIQIVHGKQNQLFEQYAKEHPKREQTLSAWEYLEKIYQKDSLFIGVEEAKQGIQKEKKRIKAADSLFLAHLPKDSFVAFYLPLRKLVSSVSTIAQYRTEEIPATIAAFRKIDYTNTRLYKSGLLANVLESHFWLMENSGRSLDSVYLEMNTSIDQIVENLADSEEQLNEISQYLFQLLEKRSLYPASEYLALKLLTQNSCTLNDDLARQLESYRAMKIGNTAPEIEFNGNAVLNGTKIEHLKFLSEIESSYKVVIFGAGWCQACVQELYQLIPLYEKWKTNKVEVVFISMDTEETIYEEWSQLLPFYSYCDFQKWDSQAVQDYYVFASPTLFLLDQDQKIILRPQSVTQIDAWVDFYLVEGNEK